MQIKIGCTLAFTVTGQTVMVLMLRPSNFANNQLLRELVQITPSVPLDDYLDGFGNRVWRLVAPVGELQISYDALVAVDPAPDPVFAHLGQLPVEQLPYDVLPFTLPSRYCDSDLLIDDAWRLFGATAAGWARVQAVCDWVHTEIVYAAGSSTAHTTAFQAYAQRRGVCRDFAHIAISLGRALNIPARYVSGYLPDIGVPPDPAPMDFHAWFEAYLDGAWYTFDARHNRPRIGRVVIGRGRDAIDLALLTSYGPAELTSILVWTDGVEVSVCAPAQEGLA